MAGDIELWRGPTRNTQARGDSSQGYLRDLVQSAWNWDKPGILLRLRSTHDFLAEFDSSSDAQTCTVPLSDHATTLPPFLSRSSRASTPS